VRTALELSARLGYLTDIKEGYDGYDQISKMLYALIRSLST